MSAAPSRDALRDFETQFDGALKAILAPFELTMQIAPMHGVDLLTTPRLEYDFTLGESTGPENQALYRALDGSPVAWRFTLGFRYVFDRTRASTYTLARVPGRLRTLLAPAAQSFNGSLLPWLTVVELDEIAAVRATYKDEPEKLLNEWFSTWTGIFLINESAWPV